MKVTHFKDKNGQYNKEQALGIIASMLAAQGFDSIVHNGQIKQFRISLEHYGYNVYALSGRRTRCLTWDQYVTVNAIINSTFEIFGWSGKVTSLQGKFVIRDLMGGKTELDWEEAGISPAKIGSEEQSVARKDYIQPMNRNSLKYLPSLQGYAKFLNTSARA